MFQKKKLPSPLLISLELSCSHVYLVGPQLPTPTIWSSLALFGTEQQIAMLAKSLYKVKLKEISISISPTDLRYMLAQS